MLKQLATCHLSRVTVKAVDSEYPVIVAVWLASPVDELTTHAIWSHCADSLLPSHHASPTKACINAQIPQGTCTPIAPCIAPCFTVCVGCWTLCGPVVQQLVTEWGPADGVLQSIMRLAEMQPRTALLHSHG